VEAGKVTPPLAPTCLASTASCCRADVVQVLITHYRLPRFFAVARRVMLGPPATDFLGGDSEGLFDGSARGKRPSPGFLSSPDDACRATGFIGCRGSMAFNGIMGFKDLMGFLGMRSG
jgi:hypothetical protein